MRPLRGAVRWLADYRNGLTIIASVVVVLTVHTVVDAGRTRNAAIKAATAEATQAHSLQQASTRRIDMLTDDITGLRSELDAVLSATTDEQRRQAVAAADARRATTTTATTAPANPPATAPQSPSPVTQPSTTTTTGPPAPPTTAPPPTTVPCTSLPVVGCVNNRASRSGTRTTLDWDALRQCESGDDYADKANPKYRGAYQFSYDTWASVGGEGDPADAPPDEQDMRARILYERSGPGQWPVCGSRL